jgi:hypothetical protein
MKYTVGIVAVEGRLTLCVFPVLSEAVTKKCCDFCGHREYYFRSGFSTLQGVGVLVASKAVYGMSMRYTVG